MEKQFIDWYKNINQNKVGAVFSPHKPLSIVYALTKLLNGQRWIEYNRDRDELERLIWEYTNKPAKPNCLQPLYRLTNDSKTTAFWQFHPSDLPTNSSGDISPSDAKKHNARAGFSDEIYQFLSKHPGITQRLLLTIIEDNFPESLVDDVLSHLNIDSIRPQLPEVEMEELTITRTKRDPNFRKKILAIYDNRCAFCQLKIKFNSHDLSMEAAHIMWKARGGPCTEQNGLALCPTHHYTFDKGVWTLDQNLAITLSPNIILDKKSDIFFSRFIGHSITDAILDDKFLPDQKFLKWHGENIFKGQ